MSRPNSTTNLRARNREGFSVMVMDSFERDGKKVEELILVCNGHAKRHSPKMGTPPHWKAGKDNEMEWIEPKGRE
jgi:hypothetical protein